jgi:hypothetical protein
MRRFGKFFPEETNPIEIDRADFFANHAACHAGNFFSLLAKKIMSTRRQTIVSLLTTAKNFRARWENISLSMNSWEILGARK